MDTQEKRNIKLIVLDLDGTLLNSKHQLSDRNRKAIQDAMALGVQVVLATGKTRASAEAMLTSLNFQTPGIFVQGLVIYNADGTIRQQQALPPAVARRIITFAEDRGFAVLAYSGNRLLTKAHHPNLDIITEFGEPEFELVGPLVNHLGDVTFNKLIVGGDDKKLTSLRWQLEQQMDGQVSFTRAQVAGMMEILPGGASKGKAMRTLIQEMGIPAEQVMAMGDGENDMDLIKFAGWGVAVGNAYEGLKAIANAVVASNDDDGVAEAIEKFVLPPKPPAPVTAEKPAETAPVVPASKPEEQA
jgi:Cof subfamily protein (haloacid dehalogenase superfamily)